MDRERFRWLVAKAVDSLPEECHTKLENVDVVAEDYPSQSQLARTETPPKFIRSLPGRTPDQTGCSLWTGATGQDNYLPDVN